MRHCNRCVLPDTKPDLQIDAEGVCSACRNYENRKEIDYEQRMKDLKMILEHYRSKNGWRYDCIVPGSGGKDSTFQALKMRELGMNPLVVTATTDHLTELGRRNIENLKRQGFDTIEVTPNPVIRRKINKFCLETVGDISWPEHVCIFTIPVRIAVQLRIPLLVWGENSQHEYGGPASASQSNVLTRRWLEEFGGLLGLRVSDVQEMLGIEPKEMLQYTYPSDDQLADVGVTGIFLGYYLPWDGRNNAYYAESHGFEFYDKLVEGSIVRYENLDNAHTGIHDYFKWLKYGFGRASDLCSMAIRRGTMTRKQAVKMVRDRDGMYPETYLGVPLDAILKSIGMTRKEFNAVCERFRNKAIFNDEGELFSPLV
jgi:N-acetyl sugar amidotransferase